LDLDINMEVKRGARMKFSIPFFGKRPAGDPEPSEENATPVSEEGERKPFVVPASADAMPSFSQPVELAGIASAQTDAVGSAASSSAVSAPAASVPPVSSPEQVKAEAVIAAVETPQQMSSMLMSQEDIIAAYKIFLKRQPESLEVVQRRVGLTGDRVLVDFLSSSEFTNRPEVKNLIFALAKKMLEEHKAQTAADDASNAATGTPATNAE